jgi:hypothetical protein
VNRKCIIIFKQEETMSRLLSKTAALLAFAIGAMAIFAGGKVLLGQDPGYYVIDWVPVYNFGLGLVSAAVTAALIWKNSTAALPAAAATLASHSIVMVILQSAYREVAASESIKAMTIRILIWAVILALLLVQAWKTNRRRSKKIQVQS